MGRGLDFKPTPFDDIQFLDVVELSPQLGDKFVGKRFTVVGKMSDGHVTLEHELWGVFSIHGSMVKLAKKEEKAPIRV
jgi:hypothetical protein